MADYDTLKGVTNIYDIMPTEMIEQNITHFLDWGLLKIGAYYNVRRSLTTYGNNYARLRVVDDDQYFTDGTVWEARRENWVWESGIPYSPAPINISGVYVNSQFYAASTTGAYAHTINYRDGQVIFNSPVNPTSIVEIEYSYKTYSVRRADEPWFQKIIFGNWIGDNKHFSQVGSGVYNILAENRVTLPFIAIEVIQNAEFEPMQLGGGQRIYQDVLLYVGSDKSWQVKQAMDIIKAQNDKTIYLYDINLVRTNNKYYFNYNGTLASGAMNYKQLVDTYLWRKGTFLNMRPQTLANGPPLYLGAVRTTVSVDFPEI